MHITFCQIAQRNVSRVMFGMLETASLCCAQAAVAGRTAAMSSARKTYIQFILASFRVGDEGPAEPRRAWRRLALAWGLRWVPPAGSGDAATSHH